MKTTTFKPPTEKPKRKPSPAQQLKAAFPVFCYWLHDNYNSDLIVLPLPCNLGNARMHWRSKHAAKEVYFSQCDLLKFQTALPPAPFHVPLVSVIAVTVYVRRLNDYDNIMARLKWPIDWLSRNNYIVDDSPKHLKWSGMPEQVLCGKGEPSRVVIRLEPSDV